MLKNTFTYKPTEKDGKIYHHLTANEYPWINIQVQIFSEDKHDESIAALIKHCGKWVIEYPERRDFAVIQIGGTAQPLNITQENHHQVAQDIHTCLVNAAECWAKQEGIIQE